MTIEVRQLIINSEVTAASGKKGSAPDHSGKKHPEEEPARKSLWSDVGILLRHIEREQER